MIIEAEAEEGSCPLLKKAVLLLAAKLLLGAETPSFKIDKTLFFNHLQKRDIQKSGFASFRAKPIMTHPQYLKYKDRFEIKEGYLLIRGEALYVRHNQNEGARIATKQGLYLQFAPRFYENLWLSGEFYAICTIPYYDRCEMIVDKDVREESVRRE